MEFDEYDYLEKAVEETGYDDDDSSKKKKRSKDGSNEKSYRSKRGDADDVEEYEERRSKRSRGGGDGDDENGERRERDRDRERERERSSRRGEVERRERRERDRDRERSGSRERSKPRRSRSRDRERSRSRRSRSRERSKSRRSRSRERSRSRRYESEREKEREREIRERERELEIRESRRSKEKKEVAEPEADPERDQRTVFAYQMPLKANERDVYEFFSRAGKVRDVRLIMDRNSRRSKGVGYIEFYDVMSVPMAIALSGQLLLGQPVMVKPSEAEKNLVQSNTSGGTSTTGPYGATDRKLYVGNLHFSITEVQLRQIFEPFGPVELVQLPLDPETGQCKGFGFVQFAQLEHAKAAQSLNGKLEIAGRLIKISSVTDHVGGQDAAVKAADLDDDEGGGLSLNAQSRALLMQKLDRSGITTSMGGPLGVSGLNGAAAATTQPVLPSPLTAQAAVPAPIFPGQVAPAQVTEPVGNPSECLLLKNMFDPTTETEPDFDLDIKEDVEEECSRYGRVKHIYVDKHSAGCVYLRFDSVDAAAKAQQAMHMRWFARRLISALFMQPHEYQAKFQGLI